MSNSEKTAFPCDGQFAGECRNNGDSGLTKREYFAAKALQGLLVQAIPGWHNNNSAGLNKEKAIFAVDMADALLEALEEKSKNLNQLENSKP